MQEAKNTARALVKIGYDGTVHKFFRGPKAEERFANECRVLRYLEDRGCEFVPRVISFDAETLELVTTNCGARVQQITDEKLKELFDELETYGVRHDDPYIRNVTYRAQDGRFCIIDFEFATLLDETASAGLPDGVAASPTGNLRVRWSGACELGWLRPNNEDRFLAIAFDRMDFTYLAKRGEVSADGFDFVFAVSDGMGGELSGEFASRCALDNITRLLPRRYSLTSQHRSGIYDCLDEVFQGTHRQLTALSQSYDEGRNMGATLSMLWLVGGWFYFAHIGDSRIYHLPKYGAMRQLTEDHTHVGWLRRQGQLNERQARSHPRKNVLSQSLGSGNMFVRPQLDSVKAEPGDQFLLCTDGVMEGLWDHAIEDLLKSPPEDLASIPAADRIVQSALTESGRDNTTALVVEVLAAE
ncbi:MAG: protein phosphatase 2C domain-containing protein [Planctomycetaceae bacterium]